MDRSPIETALIVVLFVALLIAANWLNMPKVHRWGDSGFGPTIKANRLPFRFSLRTLLIAMTLVAVVLGVIMVLAE